MAKHFSVLPIEFLIHKMHSMEAKLINDTCIAHYTIDYEYSLIDSYETGFREEEKKNNILERCCAYRPGI